jgi:hypothetical protein
MFIPTFGGSPNLFFPRALLQLDPEEPGKSAIHGRTAQERFARFLRTPAASRWGLQVGIAHRASVRIYVPIRVVNCLDQARFRNNDALPDTMGFTQLKALQSFGVNSLLALANAMEEAGFPAVAVTPIAPPVIQGSFEAFTSDRFPREGQRLLPAALLPFVSEFGLPSDMLPPDGLGSEFWTGAHRSSVREAVESARRYLDGMLKAKVRGVLDLAVPIDRLQSEDMPVRWSSRTMKCLRDFLDHGAPHRLVRVRDLLGFPGATTAVILDLIAGAEESGILVYEGEYRYPSVASDATETAAIDAEDLRAGLVSELVERLLAGLAELHSVRLDDVRIGPLLRQFPGTPASVGEVLDDPGRFRAISPARFDRAVERLAQINERIGRLSLDQELLELLDAMELGAVNLRTARLMFGAGETGSMARIADERQVTRARIHQIVCQIEETLRRCHAPILTSIASTRPIIAVAVGGNPIAEGPAAGYHPDKLRGVLRRLAACEVVLVECVGVTLVVSADEAESVRRIQVEIHRRTRKWSGGRRDQLLEAAAPDWAQTLVDRVLELSPQRQWIDRDDGVFMIDPAESRNMVVTPIRKVVAVAGRITGAELRTAILRHYRFRGIPYTSRNLVELCRKIPGLAVDGETIRSESLDEVDLLGPEEIHLWRLLRPEGTVLSRADLRQKLREAGMSVPTLTAALTYSIIVRRVTAGHYALVGTEVPPDTLDRLRIARPARGSFLVGAGRLPDGRAWMCYRATSALLESGVFSVPGAFREEMQRPFELGSLDGERRYAGNSNGQHLWFGVRFPKSERIEPGDGILMVLDPKAGKGLFVLGEPDELADRAEENEWESLLPSGDFGSSDDAD